MNTFFVSSGTITAIEIVYDEDMIVVEYPDQEGEPCIEGLQPNPNLCIEGLQPRCEEVA